MRYHVQHFEHSFLYLVRPRRKRGGAEAFSVCAHVELKEDRRSLRRITHIRRKFVDVLLGQVCKDKPRTAKRGKANAVLLPM